MQIYQRYFIYFLVSKIRITVNIVTQKKKKKNGRKDQ